ncbi:MAG: hypothetical protein R2932_55420 [Caldilineaceae bacterium]
MDTLLGIANGASLNAHNFTPIGGVVYRYWDGQRQLHDGMGKRAFGDDELSSDMATLYVVNLFDRKVCTLDVSSGVASAERSNCIVERAGCHRRWTSSALRLGLAQWLSAAWFG